MHTTQTCILEQKIIICPTLDARSAEPARFGYLTSIDVKQYEHELLPSLSNAYYLPTHSDAPW